LTVLGVKGIAILILLIAAGSTAAGVVLSGHDTPLQPKFDRTTLSFGALTVGKTSPPRTISLQAGSEAILVRPVSAHHRDEFLIDDHCPARLTGGETCTVQVQFKPRASGQRSTVLRIALSRNTTLKALLTGNGQAPPPTTAALSVRREGQGAGSVTSAPSGIDCGGTCRARFAAGVQVVLTAKALDGSTFAGWSLRSCSGTLTCKLRMNSDRSVTATFAPAKVMHVLTVRREGRGLGSVTSAPLGAYCGGSGRARFAAGAHVVLTAKARDGSTFAGWSISGCSGTLTCKLTMRSDRSVTATFSPATVTHLLTVQRQGQGDGSVTS